MDTIPDVARALPCFHVQSALSQVIGFMTLGMLRVSPYWGSWAAALLALGLTALADAPYEYDPIQNIVTAKNIPIKTLKLFFIFLPLVFF